MSKKSSSILVKVAWIGAIATFLAAVIGVAPALIKYINGDNKQKTSSIIIQDTKNSSVVTGNNNRVNSSK